MTGFGAAEGQVAGGTLRVEIRTVNHRFFNLAAKLPSDLAGLDSELRERLRRDFQRGHVAVQVRWVTLPPASGSRLTVNVERAREAVRLLRELQAAIGQNGEVPLELVTRQPDVFVVNESDIPSATWPEIEPVVAEAGQQCQAARCREGGVLVAELLGRLQLVGREADGIAARAPDRLVRELDRLRGAVSQLLDGRQVDEQRLAQEIAFLAERLDITEELVRLSAHLDACRDALAASAPVGKQLGFLAQEIGREINTVGSKANDAAMQHAVVAMKGELERFREQLENLE